MRIFVDQLLTTLTTNPLNSEGYTHTIPDVIPDGRPNRKIFPLSFAVFVFGD